MDNIYDNFGSWLTIHCSKTLGMMVLTSANKLITIKAGNNQYHKSTKTEN